MQRVISHAKERLWNGKNVAKNGTPFFGNGTVARWNGTVVGGTGDE